MPDVCVVHLVWGPLGTEPLKRFIGSYRRHPAGADHRLLVILNGVEQAALRERIDSVLAEVDCDRLELARPLLDLAAYRVAAERVGEPAVCFLNSYSEVLTGHWLGSMLRRLSSEGVGLVGATGSYESPSSEVALPYKPVFRRWFPPFPNPHVRTNAFMLPRELLLRLQWPTKLRTKYGAYRLESGRRGITRQVEAAGRRALVVGRDGEGYESSRWPQSGTYRSDGHPNLLVADNRTRQYDQADPELRRRLARMAWGRAGMSGPGH